MDPRPTPWRVFDLADPATADSPDDGSAEDPSRVGTDRETLSLPLAWTAAAVVLAVALLAVVGFLVLAAPRSTVALPGGTFEPSGSTDLAGPAGPTGPVVEVSGAVVHPGVYRLASGARVGEAITAAGGYSPRVDAKRADREIDLARLVSDGEEIRIPSRDDPSAGPGTGSGPGSGPGAGAGASHGPIDLNVATAAELDSLPGIGPATAAKIVASRGAHPFRSVNDLQTRKLLGPAAFAKLRGLVVVH
ncbi:MAG TPA: ComEA family DNA-binding protein [Candidatus Limnocylindrales bacterium]